MTSHKYALGERRSETFGELWFLLRSTDGGERRGRIIAEVQGLIRRSYNAAFVAMAKPPISRLQHSHDCGGGQIKTAIVRKCSKWNFNPNPASNYT